MFFTVGTAQLVPPWLFRWSLVVVAISVPMLLLAATPFEVQLKNNDCRECAEIMQAVRQAKPGEVFELIVGVEPHRQAHVRSVRKLNPRGFSEGIWSGSGARPRDMPPRKGDREFDGGPDFGNGSWAQKDEDGHWARYGG